MLTGCDQQGPSTRGREKPGLSGRVRVSLREFCFYGGMPPFHSWGTVPTFGFGQSHASIFIPQMIMIFPSIYVSPRTDCNCFVGRVMGGGQESWLLSSTRDILLL